MGNSFLEKLLSTHTHQASLFLRRFAMPRGSVGFKYIQKSDSDDSKKEEEEKEGGGDNKCNESGQSNTNDGAKSGGGGDKAPEKNE